MADQPNWAHPAVIAKAITGVETTITKMRERRDMWTEIAVFNDVKNRESRAGGKRGNQAAFDRSMRYHGLAILIAGDIDDLLAAIGQPSDGWTYPIRDEESTDEHSQ